MPRRKIWFSIREPVTCHLYDDCGSVDRIYAEHEAEAFVEVDGRRWPNKLPPMARICELCERQFNAEQKT